MHGEQQDSAERINKTALVIDDDADRRNYVKTLLQENGFAVRIHDQVFETPGLIRLLSPDLILFATDMKGLTQEKLQFIIDSNEQSKNIPMLFIPHTTPQALCRAAGLMSAKTAPD